MSANCKQYGKRFTEHKAVEMQEISPKPELS